MCARAWRAILHNAAFRKWHVDTDRQNAVNTLTHFTASDRELEAWLHLLEIQAEQILEIGSRNASRKPKPVPRQVSCWRDGK
jgi:hypothetical protein